MICIWDNGGEYSDHGVYYFDCSTIAPDVVREALAVMGGSVVGFVEPVGEWKKECLASLPKFLADNVGYRATAALQVDPVVAKMPKAERMEYATILRAYAGGARQSAEGRDRRFADEAVARAEAFEARAARLEAIP